MARLNVSTKTVLAAKSSLMAPKNQVSKKAAGTKGKGPAPEVQKKATKAAAAPAKKSKAKPISPEYSSDSDELEMRMMSDSEDVSSEDMPKLKKVYGIRS